MSSSQIVNTNIQGANEPDGFIDIVECTTNSLTQETKKHMKYCKVCQESQQHKKKSTDSDFPRAGGYSG